jgi:hypothetical protein
MSDYVIHFRAYGEYNKTELTYAQHYFLFVYLFIYLFIFFVRLLPDMFRQVTIPLSRDYIKLHKTCMKYNANTKC